MPNYRNRLLCAAAAMALPLPVVAQEADTGAEDVSAGDIVVTAQKRSQSIQQVPVAISALNSAMRTSWNPSSLPQVLMAAAKAA